MSSYFFNAMPVAAASIMAFIAVKWVYFKILHIAQDKNLVDNPNARKLQSIPVPVTGGLAVFFGVAMGMLTGYAVGGIMEMEFQIQILPVLAAMVVMLYIGAMDDMMGLTPRARLVIEILAVLGLIFASGGCIDTFHGLWGIDSFSWWLAVPLTVFAGVGIINAVNMVDGVNGLSSTLCMLSSVFYGIIFVRSGDVANATLAFTVATALFPFMLHNIFGVESRMFIGDAGTMVMGILLTWFTMSILRSDSPISYYDTAEVNTIAFALAVLCVPIFDSIRVMFMRIVKKKSPFKPDMTHLHHVFVNVGVSHIITTLTEALISLSVFATWTISVQMGADKESQLYIVVATSILLVWGSYGFLRYHADRHTEFLHDLTEVNIRTHLGRTTWWQRFSKWLDTPSRMIIWKGEEENDPLTQPSEIIEEPVAPNNYKEQDRVKVLNFMKGRSEVMVHDIINNSGVDKFRIYSILYEEIQKGRVRVIKEGWLGYPEIVALSK